MNTDTLLDVLDRTESLNLKEESVVIEAFMERYDVNYDEARDIFDETKKWLWLSSKSIEDRGSGLFIDRSLYVIDEMWHNFILHTKLYYKFCIRSFNGIVHHSPTPKNEKIRFQNAYQSNAKNVLMQKREELSGQLSYIYDELGTDTLLKWYETMAEKYTPEYLKSIEKT